MHTNNSDRKLTSELETRPLDSYLREQVTDLAFPPATSKPILLPFDRRSPEDFERICVLVAEQIDGLHDVRLYGVSGQTQLGIDLVGWDNDNQAVVYQARRWVKFTDSDLRKAVDDYCKMGRVFSAKRFVLCVACSARRTEIIDELDRQRKCHDFEIDLYDQERLSEKLRLRSDLVRRLFGADWARHFCDGEALEAPVRSSSDILADALLRGPLEAIGLASSLEEADRLSIAEPSTAAKMYEGIAIGLESGHFAGFSNNFRTKQVDCLIRSGDLEKAIVILTTMTWRDVEKGMLLRAQETARKLSEIARRHKESEIAALYSAVFYAIDRWCADPINTVEAIESHVLRLLSQDAPSALQTALWLAESALIAENYGLILRNEKEFRTIAAKWQAKQISDGLAIRLRLCIADANGDWADLSKNALMGSLGPKLAALVHSRRARYEAWHGESKGAYCNYRLAIGQACQAGLNAEAAAALRSICTLGVQFGLPWEDWGGAHDLSNDIQVAGTDYFQSGYDLRQAGLSEMSDGNLPNALGDLLMYLRSSVLSGRLASEMDAHLLLGRLYSQAKVLNLSARHFIRAGNTDELELLFSKLETFVDCSEELNRSSPWEQASALLALASEGDLVPDSLVDHLTKVALKAAAEQPQGCLGQPIWKSAYELLAALAPRIPAHYIVDILNLLHPQIEREPNHYRFNDDQHVRIIVGLYHGNTENRDKIAAHLVALLGASPELGEKVCSIGWNAIRDDKQLFIGDLKRLAEGGSNASLRALLHLGIGHPLLLQEAQRLFEIVVKPPERVPGQYGIGSILPRAATFMRVLASEERTRFVEVAFLIAEDETEIESNRSEALRAIEIVANVISDILRSSFFKRAILLSENPRFSELDNQLKAGLHPLSRVRINLSSGSMVPQAICTAAALVQSKEECTRIVEAVSPMLKSNDESASNLAIRALYLLPREMIESDIVFLASSPLIAARKLAAVLWTCNPGDSNSIGNALATDSVQGVRLILAHHLSMLVEKRLDFAECIARILRLDPSAAVRAEVEKRLQKDL
jgi:hypothetical protein